MKNLLISVGILSIFLTAGGCKKTAAPQQAALPVNVVTVIEKEVNEWDEFTGRLDPVESVEIRPRVSGYITEIRFEAGAIVKKGDLLYVSDQRITVGNLVQPGAGPESVLTTVISVDPIYAKVDADENAILKYVKLSEEGKRVSARTAKIPAWIELGNETDFPHEGYVDFVD